MLPYRIYGAYDSETANIDDAGRNIAYPILHQLGILDGHPVESVFPHNVEELLNVSIYRHAHELYSALDDLLEADLGFVPVIMCHNLAFDMYGLSQWLERHDVRVLAKSARKPITFTIKKENGQTGLVIWDTLVFSQQSLERMGEDCGYAKASGSWDYELVRTPETPLTDDELVYAKRDLYALVAWMGWWLRRNPDIKPNRLGLNVVTKTGVVRERRRVRFDQVRGVGLRYNVGRMWMYRCREEQAKSDDELFTMLACTRGGFTFCASNSASVPYDLEETDEIVAAYDAVSQHPAQLVSHKYPVRFREMPPRVLELAFDLIGKVTLNHVLEDWAKPFPVAFDACFTFVNLRPKRGTLYERFGIYPLASARYRSPEQLQMDDDNGDRAAWMAEMHARFYRDVGEGVSCAFGKVISADRVTLYLTELAAWEVWQAYEWDSVEAVHGYETGRFTRACDMDLISVMRFYEAKDAFKLAKGEYAANGRITNGSTLVDLGVAPAIVEGMENGILPQGDVDAVYMGLKADLNSIFGISASNQYRRPTVLGEDGIEYIGEFGIANAPKNPKVWYQFGQRIVGWSRIAQICALELMAPYVREIVNGDTDSVKAVVKCDDLPSVDAELARLAKALDAGKAEICEHVETRYPELYNPLIGIGHYELEFTADRFCASWNKAYCEQGLKKGSRRFSFTLAGIPTRRREGANASFIGINGLADRFYGLGWSFSQVCNLFLGYNVTYSHDTMRMNGRTFPSWGEGVYKRVRDYRGDVSLVAEPAALALHPMVKTVNDTSNRENAVNCKYALRNNPDVNVVPKLIWSGGVFDMGVDDFS